MSFRFVPPTDDLPGFVQEGEKIVTAEYMTPAQARNRAKFWSRAKELRKLEALREEMTSPEWYVNERGA